MPHSSTKSKDHKRHKDRSRSRERKHTHRDRRSPERNIDLKRERHSPERQIKREKLTPERTIKRERHSPNRDRHSPDGRRHIKRERRSPSDVRRVKQERLSPEPQTHSKWSPGETGDHRRQRDGDRDRHRRPHANQDRYKGQRERNDDRRVRDKRRKQKSGGGVDDSQYEYGKPGQGEEETIAEEDKSKPDYGLSGKLADDTNTFRGVVVNYNEPPEARKPKLKWRLYPFKGDDAMPVLHIHRQSGYLLGRDRKVADIPIDHPSCSKQHAVLQFRSVDYTKEDGTKGRRTRPYIIDLGSANGTFVNNNQIESKRYVELLEKDTIKFGFSSRDYVILHDNVEVSPAAEGVD